MPFMFSHWCEEGLESFCGGDIRLKPSLKDVREGSYYEEILLLLISTASTGVWMTWM